MDAVFGTAPDTRDPHLSFMAGHNKWSKVKHIKARVDVAKGKLFSKCAHEISIAARDGGGDPTMNHRLRAAIDNARSVSMPKDNIERAIKKGTGELGGEAFQEVTYEGYGPAGTAFLIEGATDNLNRTAADVRSIFTKNGGSVATPGSVSYQFDRKGEIRLRGGAGDELMLAAIEAGAEDVVDAGGDGGDGDEDSEVLVFTAPDELAAVAAKLRELGHEPAGEQLISLPQASNELAEAEVARQAVRLYEQLDDHPDVLNVFTNFDLSEELVELLGS